jgi:hypothetical protein
MNTKYSMYIGCIGLVLLLPQCNWFGGQSASTESETGSAQTSESSSGTSEVLLTIGGKAHGLAHELDAYFEKIFSIQPAYRQFIEAQPNMKKELAQGFFTERILNQWVAKNKIDQTPEYKKELEEGIQMLKQQLAVKMFQEKNPVTLSAEDVRKYYDENKEQQGIKTSDGGVATMAVSFGSEKAAQDFLEAVKAANVDFEKTAKDKKLMAKNYREVSDKRYDVPAPVRKKITEITQFPSVVIVKVDDKNWEVIKAFKKETAQYVPFEQIKDQIADFLKQQKMMQQFEFDGPVMRKIREELGVQVNTEALDRLSGAKKEQASAQPVEDRASAVTPVQAADASTSAPVESETAAA